MTQTSNLQTWPERAVRRYGVRRLLVVALSLLLSVVSGAPSGMADTLTRLPVPERVETPTGPPHSSVNAILEDHEGFLWVGTYDGLARYDGYEFRVFRHDLGDPRSLSSSTVNVLVEDRRGRIWVGTDLGLNLLDRKTWSFEPIPVPGIEAPSDAVILTGLEDRQGALWFGSSLGLLYIPFDGDPIQIFRHGADDTHSLRFDWVSFLQEDSAGMLWVATRSPPPLRVTTTLQRHHGAGRFTAVARPVGTPEFLTSFFIDSGDRVWIESHGPLKFDLQGERLQGDRNESLGGDDHVFLEASSGTLWVGSSEGLWAMAPEGDRPVHVPLSRRPSAWLQNYVEALHEDRSGILWVGTLGGLFKLDPNRKSFFHLGSDAQDPESLSAPAVSSIVEMPGGALFAGTFGGGLCCLDREADEFCRRRAGLEAGGALPDDVIWDLHVDDTSMLWIGGHHLTRFDPANGSASVMAVHPIPAGEFWSLLEYPEGTFWLGSITGLFRYQSRTSTLEGPLPLCAEGEQPRRRDVNALARSGDTVWIGGSAELAAWHVDTGEVRCVPLTATDGTPVQSPGTWDLHVAGDRILWIGNSVGLLRYDPVAGEIEAFTTRDGLPGSVVYSILEDDAARLWLGTNQGLCRFDPAARAKDQFRTFAPSDGLGNVEFNRHAALRSQDGSLFFGGMDGLTFFDPDQISSNTYIPPVHLTRIEVSNRGGLRDVNPHGLETLELTHRDSTFAFEFAALSYADPGENQYAYRLAGFDHTWVESGSRRYAQYTSIPPGRYRFQVRGSNDDGLWNEDGLTLPVTIHPAPWQTWWFRLLAAVMILSPAVVFGAYRLAKHREMERLRLRIAGDLHDDLSSKLSGIAVVADMLRQGEHVEEEERKDLLTIRDGALDMVDGVRDIVWLINPEHDTLDGLDTRMRSTASTLLRGLEVEFRGGLGDGSAHLPMAVRRNVFLIFKEALHNVVRHARARRVEIDVRRDGGLSLRVTDDGKGFDPDDGGGHGLGSMERRAREIGARFEIRSSPGQGTEVRLALEIPRFRDSLNRTRD